MFKSNLTCEPFTQGGGGEFPFIHTLCESVNQSDYQTLCRGSIHTSLLFKDLLDLSCVSRVHMTSPSFAPKVQVSGACVKGAVKGSRVCSFHM